MENNTIQKIFLVGYMGSGKTTLGKLLAKKLNLQFIDVDLFIENRYRKSIPVIFEEKGEEGFREIERRTLQEISGFENIVISTGGGLPCFFDNMEMMNQAGTTIYLKISVGELARRLQSGQQKRPLIQGKNQQELIDYITLSLQSREKFYSQASFVYEIEGQTSLEDINLHIDRLINCLSKGDTDESNANTN
jgi:shikimate kinase